MTLLKRFLAVAPRAISRAFEGVSPTTVSPDDDALVEAELSAPARIAPGPQTPAPTATTPPASVEIKRTI